MLEILLVPHGAAHNDTIVTVERKGGKTCCDLRKRKSHFRKEPANEIDRSRYSNSNSSFGLERRRLQMKLRIEC